MASVEDYECKRSLRKTRALATDRRYSGICSEVRNGFVCADCKTAVNCVEGVAYTENCGTGDMCDERVDYGGAVCYPTPPENCTCSSPNNFFVDAYDRQMFFFCDDAGSEPDLYHCPGDMQFDVESKQCSNQYDLPQCMVTGVFAVYSDCSQYYTCIASKDGWVQKPFSCENDLMYNEDTGICEDPCSWETGSFTCQEEGRFTDPISCNHYYECVQVGESFRQDRRQCPDGYQWDPTALVNNGHCTKDSNNTCNPVKVSECLIPEGQCAAGDVGGETVPRGDGGEFESHDYLIVGDDDVSVTGRDGGVVDVPQRFSGGARAPAPSRLSYSFVVENSPSHNNDPRTRLRNILNRGNRRARGRFLSN